MAVRNWAVCAGVHTVTGGRIPERRHSAIRAAVLPPRPFDERTVAELTARHPVQAAGAALLTCPSPTGKFCSAGYQPRPGGELTREAVIRAYPAAPSRIAAAAIPVSATARSTSIPVRET